MKSVSAPISLAGSELRETRHVCAFFNNDEEEYRTLLPNPWFSHRARERRHNIQVTRQ
jgi:hypothetical protein